MPTYPSLKPTFTVTSHLGKNRGRWAVSQNLNWSVTWLARKSTSPRRVFFFSSPAYRLENADKSVLEPTHLARQMTWKEIMVSCLKNSEQHFNNVLPLISPSYNPFNYSLVKRAVIISKHKLLKHELTWLPCGTFVSTLWSQSKLWDVPRMPFMGDGERPEI